MKVLVTGAAGFIGFHCAMALAARGETVVGIDNLVPYYDVALKEARLDALRREARGFEFRRVDIADRGAFEAAVAGDRFDVVVHLAAQPGVRASITNPHIYATANLVAHLNVIEYFRHHDTLEHLVYASSSSVYGANKKLPFSEDDRVDDPVSLYAATKRADELLSESYIHLYGMPMTGVRFFTVYGPWGRPDMAVWTFVESILKGRPITLNNYGRMRRDFTFIGDVIGALVEIASGPPRNPSRRPQVYNIGNSRSEDLRHVVSVVETAVGRAADIVEAPLPQGDVIDTHADLTRIKADYGYEPTTPIDVGIPAFVAWYREHYGIA